MLSTLSIRKKADPNSKERLVQDPLFFYVRIDKHHFLFNVTVSVLTELPYLSVITQ